MSRKLLQFKLDKLVKDHKKYKFPEFITLLRKTLGYSRMMITEELGIKYDRLMRMETGRAVTIYLFEIGKISEFYGVKKSILLQKNLKHNSDIRQQNCILICPKTAEIWDFGAS